MNSQHIIWASLGVAFLVACGGATSNPSGAPDASASSSGSSGGSSGGGASSGGSSGAGTSSGGSSSGGAGADAGSLIPPGTTPGSGAVTCAGTVCTAPDVCCSGGGTPACSTLAACNAAGSDSYTCTGPANCTTPDVCCVHFAAGRAMPNDIAVCQPTCTGANTALVCQRDAECPAGAVCRTGGAAAQGVSICQPPLISPGGTAGTGTATCGTVTCAAPNVCCSSGGGRFTCSTLSACDGSGNDSYTCTGQANCAAPSVCCVNFGQNAQNDVSNCQASCAGGNSAQVCQTNAECPAGMACRAGGGVPAGITICRPPVAMPEGGTGAVDAASEAAPPAEAGTPPTIDSGTPVSEAGSSDAAHD